MERDADCVHGWSDDLHVQYACGTRNSNGDVYGGEWHGTIGADDH
jgi:hypothetical protein